MPHCRASSQLQIATSQIKSRQGVIHSHSGIVKVQMRFSSNVQGFSQELHQGTQGQRQLTLSHCSLGSIGHEHYETRRDATRQYHRAAAHPDFMPSACHLKPYLPDLHDVRGACMTGSRCIRIVDCAGLSLCSYSAKFHDAL